MKEKAKTKTMLDNKEKCILNAIAEFITSPGDCIIFENALAQILASNISIWNIKSPEGNSFVVKTIQSLLRTHRQFCKNPRMHE